MCSKFAAKPGKQKPSGFPHGETPSPRTDPWDERYIQDTCNGRFLGTYIYIYIYIYIRTIHGSYGYDGRDILNIIGNTTVDGWNPVNSPVEGKVVFSHYLPDMYRSQVVNKKNGFLKHQRSILSKVSTFEFILNFHQVAYELVPCRVWDQIQISFLIIVCGRGFSQNIDMPRILKICLRKHDRNHQIGMFVYSMTLEYWHVFHFEAIFVHLPTYCAGSCFNIRQYMRSDHISSFSIWAVTFWSL